MKMKKKNWFATSLVLVVSFLLAACGTNTQAPTTNSASKQETKYPTKQVTMIVPVAAGGVVDLAARAMAKGFQDETGQPLIVENYPSGAGVPGTMNLVKAKPDGYTLGMISSGQLNIRPLLQNVEYSYPKDFTPIIGIADFELSFAVKADAPYNTVKDMVKYYTDKNEAVKVGISPANSAGQFILNEITAQTGLKVRIVPYDGNNKVVTDLIGGQLDVGMANLSTVSPLVQSKKIKIISVCAGQRFKNLPNVPTLLEQGINVTGGSSFAIYGPANLPKDLVSKLQDLFTKSMQGDVFQKFATNSNLYVTQSSPADVTKEIQDGFDQMQKVIKKN